MRVLCVAEKPSIAKSISGILSGGQLNTRNSPNKYVKNYEFNYPQTNSRFVVTSVLGHLTTLEFPDQYRKWTSCDPIVLFDSQVLTSIPDDKKGIEKNLFNEAKNADMLMIWTDCDREGEHIGTEIESVCRRAKRNIQVKRARFSAIIAQQIHNAAQHPVDLDRRLADAVYARQVLDLKIGAAFTRFQTHALKPHIPAIQESGFLSYGPCQFPTLGFVVARYLDVRNFRPEPFWYIYLTVTRPSHSQQEDAETVFTWRRGHLFSEDEALVLFEKVLDNPTAKVTKVTKKETKKFKPLPLTTVELQKAGSRLLKLSPKKVLDVLSSRYLGELLSLCPQIAESLYQQGFLSYPRTETDQYDPKFDFMSLIEKQTADPAWGGFANSLQEGEFNAPRKGKNNDHAHPPIHPTAHAGNLTGDNKKVYEFITRRFLASCSKDAKGWETTIDIECGGEEFHTKGLRVLERNYLEVYPYDKWSDKELPDFTEGEEFQPSVCDLREGQTTSPSYLTEADLVTLMDKNGIGLFFLLSFFSVPCANVAELGTDATIAQHIETIVNREYVIEHYQGNTKHLIPSTLGIGLIEGYNSMTLDRNLSKPHQRRETERQLVQVCQGGKSKHDMIEENIEQYKNMYVIARREFDQVVGCIRRYLTAAGDNGGAGGDNANGGGANGGGGGGGGGVVVVVVVVVAMAVVVEVEVAEVEVLRLLGAVVVHPDPEALLQLLMIPMMIISVSDLPPDPPAPKPASRARKPRSTATTTKATTSTAKPNSRSTGSSSSSGGVQCQCNVPAKQLTITDDTASRGRPYWTCGNNNACNFWQWADRGQNSNVQTNAFASSSSSTSTAPPPPSASRQSAPEVQAEDVPMCNCNVPAVTRNVTKESVHKGRPFWTCGKDRTCDYFQWGDESPKTVPTKRTYSQTQTGTRDSTDDPAARNCTCNKPATRLTVHKEGANKGRQFWRCASDSCKFFEWDDEPGGGGNSRSGGSSGSGEQSCFNCGQSGHWASACPKPKGDSGSDSKRGRSFGSSASNFPQKGSGGADSTDECFKCGRTGHWASACPNPSQSSSFGSGSRTESYTSSSSSRGSKSTRGGRGSRGGRGRGGKTRASKTKSGFSAPIF
ncbi:hypothetical protein D9758_005864 [Tetrapyrgos nigripes]|uniref:DNA topoisomerase n=1 Tax=Tetrapyrgos nigripes TaxID=182062 RepID=A0A8H5G2Y5_9AGAR|nr:hypothetical protein D9758_005864 [Tetrapyrgos nigripes]